MFFKKYYNGHILKKYDSNQKELILKNVYFNDYNLYTQKDFLNLRDIYNQQQISNVLKDIQNLKKNPNKISVPFLEILFYSKYKLELLPFDLKVTNALMAINTKLNNRYTIKEFEILTSNNDTFNVNTLYLISYDKKLRLHCDLIYQDSCLKTIKAFKTFLDDTKANNINFFLKNFSEVNLFQDVTIGNFINKNKKCSSNYFVNKFSYDFESPYFRQIAHNIYKDNTNYTEEDDFDFSKFDEYFDGDFDSVIDQEFIKNFKLSKEQCYELFGLTINASVSDIKRAYRTKARIYHPDINKENDAEDKFKEINAAYKILMQNNNKENA